jgi:hypothetical protein
MRERVFPMAGTRTYRTTRFAGATAAGIAALTVLSLSVSAAWAGGADPDDVPLPLDVKAVVEGRRSDGVAARRDV